MRLSKVFVSDYIQGKGKRFQFGDYYNSSGGISIPPGKGGRLNELTVTIISDNRDYGILEIQNDAYDMNPSLYLALNDILMDGESVKERGRTYHIDNPAPSNSCFSFIYTPLTDGQHKICVELSWEAGRY